MVFCISTLLGVVAVASSIWLLDLGLRSDEPDSIFKRLGLSDMEYGHVQTMLYLKISLSDFLTVNMLTLDAN